MTDAEVDALLDRSRTAVLGTVGRDGTPHLAAMWYAYLDGALYVETKAKSQKAVNLRRNPACTVLVEAGDTYDQLRGVAIDGRATIIDDNGSDEYWRAAVNVHERYTGEYDEAARPVVEMMMHKRVVVRIDPLRTRSWDHRKLGLPALPLAGRTAATFRDP